MNYADAIKAALLSVLPEVYHDWPTNSPARYVVWQEDGAIGVKADNLTADSGMAGAVHLFTVDAYDPAVVQVPAALEAAGLAVAFGSAQHEDVGRRYHHWEWLWEYA